MKLESGARLGPYEILAPLGAGGMGEVYSATDTRLDRRVAIKTLRSDVTNQPQLRERLEREAKAVSSLNHPHICTLYDVGEAEGVTYLVMEFLEGESLVDRLARGPLPLDQALQYGVQIAEALDKAHGEGVVHRDIKPGNVMLTKTGVKLLDFGLAKLSEGEGGPRAAGMTAMPTQSRPLTAEGTILGTLGYMAPEQLEGKEADARTDVFAFGIVLYEMVTGRAPFKGDSQVSIIAAILKSDPPAITTAQPMSPPALDRVVQRCLAKEPDDRWQSARDLASELTWIATGGSQADVPIPARSRRRSREPLAWGLVAVFALAFGLALRVAFQGAGEERQVRLSILPPEGATPSMVGGNAAVSPDGRHVAFVATDSANVASLWVRTLEASATQELDGTENATLPFWSPDSRSLAFFDVGLGKLKKVALSGGPAQILCDAPAPRGGSWSADDVILFAPTSGGPLLRVNPSGGKPVEVTHIDSTRSEAAHRYPQFLPDGRHFLYTVLPGRDGLFETRVGSLDSGESRLVTAARTGAIYVDPGYLIFPHEQSLMAQPFDAKRLETTGEPLSIREYPGGQGIYTAGPLVSLSTADVLVVPAGRLPDTRFVWFDRTGQPRGSVDVPPGRYYNLRIAPDGSRVAVVRQNTVNTSDIWLVELSRAIATRLTFESSWNLSPVWSPDGSRLVFSSDRTGGHRVLYQKDLGGTGRVEPLTGSSGPFDDATDWSPDGRFIVYSHNSERTGNDIWILPPDDHAAPVPFAATSFDEGSGRVSPDGRWIAYHSNESGRFEVYVQSFPTPGDKYQVSGDGGDGPQWSVDGKELFFRTPDRATLMVARVGTGVTFGTEPPRALFELPTDFVSIAPGPDGQSFLVIVPESEGALSPLTVVLNWTAALGR